MKVLILHDAVTEGSRPDEIDTLRQAELVTCGLRALGHRTEALGVGLNLEDLSHRLAAARADLVFNLVESLGSSGRLIPVVPAFLEARRVVFTGSGSIASLLTTNKPLAKSWMYRHGVPTPAWKAPREPVANDIVAPCSVILKPAWEDASVGIDDGAIRRVRTRRDVDEALASASRRHGDVFAETFIDGREFNLSLLADGEGVEVLPVAEIEFVDYPEGKPRIVGYQAKWDADAFEYNATPRRFDHAASDRSLLDRLRSLAVQCWSLFGLGGYARVDFRVDDAGRPWVLEVNVNPCLSGDAGFMAAAGQRGLDARHVVERIIAAATMQRVPTGSAGHV